MAKQRFKITKFTNPSGESVWRVAGTLNGQRIRKNFSSRQEAVAERQKLEVRHLNESSDGQTVWTTLTHDQNRDAIAAINLLKRSGSQKSLTFAVDYLLQHYQEPSERKTIEKAVPEYLDEKSKEEERGLISTRQMKSIKMELSRFKEKFASRLVAEIQPDDLKKYLETPANNSQTIQSFKTWNNRRGYLSTFFKFCLKNKYVVVDPVLDVPKFKVKQDRGVAQTLSAKEAEEFMHWLESYRGKQNQNGSWWGKRGCMVPYFALALFAGVRPDWQNGELSKLQSEHIRLDTGVIFIEPSVSKIGEKRSIKIQPNLLMWLKKYPLDKYPIIPHKRFSHMWTDIRKSRNLGHDVLRHTYISMTVGAFRSVGDAALQAGNSESVIRKHYLDLKSVEEADAFWSIAPKSMQISGKMEKKDGRYVTTSAEKK